VIDRGPEDEWKDWICQGDCGSVYFGIERERAQRLHDKNRMCCGVLRELTEDD
jgi:hypothetical protein